MSTTFHVSSNYAQPSQSEQTKNPKGEFRKEIDQECQQVKQFFSAEVGKLQKVFFHSLENLNKNVHALSARVEALESKAEAIAKNQETLRLEARNDEAERAALWALSHSLEQNAPQLPEAPPSVKLPSIRSLGIGAFSATPPIPETLAAQASFLPQHADLQNTNLHIGLHHYTQKQFSEAEAALIKIPEGHDFYQARSLLAACALNLGKYQEAIHYAKDIPQGNSDYDKCQWIIGVAHSARSEFQDAYLHFQPYLKDTAIKVNTQFAMARCCFEIGKFNEAYCIISNILSRELPQEIFEKASRLKRQLDEKLSPIPLTPSHKRKPENTPISSKKSDNREKFYAGKLKDGIAFFNQRQYEVAEHFFKSIPTKYEKLFGEAKARLIDIQNMKNIRGITQREVINL